jgi:hypothetical protein
MVVGSMSNDFGEVVDALMKNVKDLRADMKGILSALHGKPRHCVGSARQFLHESGTEQVDEARDAAGRWLPYSSKVSCYDARTGAGFPVLAALAR